MQTSPRFFSAQHRVYMAAAIILVAGWAAAAWVYFGSVNPGDPAAAGWQIVGGQSFSTSDGDSKGDAQTERLGGKATVRVARFDDWLGSLWHGRRLAVTLAVSSSVVAAVCAYIAGLMAESVDPDSSVGPVGPRAN